eukprot:3422656-Amphidinium_carterae.3
MEEDDEASHKHVRPDDDDGKWGSARLSKLGEVSDVAVTVPMDKNEVDYSNISAAEYYDLVDEDTGQKLQPSRGGVHREMKFLKEQRLGEPFPRNQVPGKAVIWTARWVHRIKGDGVRSRYVARQFKNASAVADSEVCAATPRLESIRILRAWGHGHCYMDTRFERETSR